MKKNVCAALLALFSVYGFAQERYALVIGNGVYKNGAPPLNNPVHDAEDMAAALRKAGFAVDMLKNATLEQMEAGQVRLRDNLSGSSNAYGFFFYAGHGVQVQGSNYLIPVDADIKSESLLSRKAFDVQALLDELGAAKNQLNIIVLDACRDNPFSWSRSGSRGLAMVERTPPGAMVVYATSAGEKAEDGAGRNGLFTAQLLKNLTLNIEVKEVFNRTGADVFAVSEGRQRPAVYNQFYGNVYFMGAPAQNAPYQAAQPPAPVQPASPPPVYAAAPPPARHNAGGLLRLSFGLGGGLGIDNYTPGKVLKDFGVSENDTPVGFVADINVSWNIFKHLALETDLTLPLMRRKLFESAYNDYFSALSIDTQLKWSFILKIPFAVDSFSIQPFAGMVCLNVQGNSRINIQKYHKIYDIEFPAQMTWGLRVGRMFFDEPDTHIIVMPYFEFRGFTSFGPVSSGLGDVLTTQNYFIVLGFQIFCLRM